MWEVCSNLSWRETKDKKFEDWEDALWAFRGEITKALGKDRKRLDFFLDLIDQYFAKTHKKKPLPKGVEQFKEFLIRYVTDPTFPADEDSFTIEPYEDRKIKICYEGKKVEIQAKKNKFVGEIPIAMIPVVPEDAGETVLQFVLSNNPTLIFPCPGSETAYILLGEAEDEEEDYDEDDEDDEYDEDEEDDEDEDDDYYDDDEDEDEDDDEEVTRSYAPPRPSYSRYSRPAPPPPPPKPKPLSVFERAELNSARTRYDQAVRRHAFKRNTSTPEIANLCEADEKRAFVELMRIEAKYAGRE